MGYADPLFDISFESANHIYLRYILKIMITVVAMLSYYNLITFNKFVLRIEYMSIIIYSCSLLLVFRYVLGFVSGKNILIMPPRSIYRQTSNIRRALVGNQIVDHSDVVGASALLQLHLHSRLNTWLHYITKRQLHDETRNILSFGIWCACFGYLTVCRLNARR